MTTPSTTNDEQTRAALDALTADSRSTHRACLRLVARTNPDLANQIAQTNSKYFTAGTPDDPARRSYSALLERLGPVASTAMPPLIVATVPRASLWAATAPFGERWLVVIPGGVLSFYRAFCTTVFLARDSYAQSPGLEESVERMSRLVGTHLELGTVDFSGGEHLQEKSKPILEHLTQLAYEFFLLHEGCHIMKRHREPDPRETTWYQEAHLRHTNEFDADQFAFNMLLTTFRNQMHFVVVAVALLFDALDLLDRFDFAPMTRLTHPSPAARKWRLIRLLEDPDAVEFLDRDLLRKAREFSHLYERLAAFIVDKAVPTSPLNEALNMGEKYGPQAYVQYMLEVMACGDPGRIVENLATMRRSFPEWLEGGTPDDIAWAKKVALCVDSLVDQLGSERSLRQLSDTLIEAARPQRV